MAGPAGLLIPVRDTQRRIVALKIRVDEPGDWPKYLYLSSTQHGGPGPGSQPHVPLFHGDTTTARITEGELKGDVATVISRMLSIGLAGVSVWLSAVATLKELGTLVVRVAVDADARHNRFVARALESTARGLAEKGFLLEVESWVETDGKGIDDLLSAGKTPVLHQGNDAWAAIAEIVQAAKEADPTPDERALAEASKRLADLAAKLKDDPGFAFNQDTLEALFVLKGLDKSGFARAWEICRKAKVSLKQLGQELAKLQQARRTQDAEQLQGETDDRTAGFMLYGDCPWPGLVIPEPFFVTPTSTGFIQMKRDKETGEETSTRVEFAYSPILIIGKLLDADDGDSYFRLAWLRPGGWRHHVAGRAIALDFHKQVELAAYDFPTASQNAKNVVAYLHSFEASNLGHMPVARISSHMGWQGQGGEDGFLWGQTFLSPDGKTRTAIDLEDLSEWHAEALAFRGKTPGDEQIAGGYHAAGTLEGWAKAVSTIPSYPKALIIFYASFVPALQLAIGAPNFTIETVGRTTTGKTTCLKIAASIWGNPDERSGDGAIWTWDVTRVFLERCSAIISGMPLILDDTKRVKDPKMVADLLYTVESGRGRGRGNTKSLAQTRTWKTVLLSSGETPASSYTQAGGAKTRILEVRGLPFDGDGETTRLLVDQLNLQVQSNYGHAGPIFVQFLMQNRDRWPEYREKYLKQVSHYAAKAGAAGPEAGRLAQYAAAIDMGAVLAHAALDLPWDYRDPLANGLWEAIVDEATDAAGEIRAFRDVFSWANANQEAFVGRHRTDQKGELIPPSGGMAGRWDSQEDWEFIGFHKPILVHILQDMEYEPDAILGHWRERGWLDTDGDRKRFEKKVKLRGEQVRLVVIPREVLTEVAE
jgi:hypothetical protein